MGAPRRYTGEEEKVTEGLFTFVAPAMIENHVKFRPKSVVLCECERHKSLNDSLQPNRIDFIRTAASVKITLGMSGVFSFTKGCMRCSVAPVLKSVLP